MSTEFPQIGNTLEHHMAGWPDSDGEISNHRFWPISISIHLWMSTLHRLYDIVVLSSCAAGNLLPELGTLVRGVFPLFGRAAVWMAPVWHWHSQLAHVAVDNSILEKNLRAYRQTSQVLCTMIATRSWYYYKRICSCDYFDHGSFLFPQASHTSGLLVGSMGMGAQHCGSLQITPNR